MLSGQAAQPSAVQPGVGAQESQSSWFLIRRVLAGCKGRRAPQWLPPQRQLASAGVRFQAGDVSLFKDQVTEILSESTTVQRKIELKSVREPVGLDGQAVTSLESAQTGRFLGGQSLALRSGKMVRGDASRRHFPFRRRSRNAFVL